MKKKQESSLKLPVQLATLIHGEAATLADTDKPTDYKDGSLNSVISATQNRHVKELASYVRAVCMRISLVPE